MAFGITEARLNQEKYRACCRLPIALLFSIPPPLSASSSSSSCLSLSPPSFPSLPLLLLLPPLLHITFLYDFHSGLSWDILTTTERALGIKCILKGPGFTFPPDATAGDTYMCMHVSAVPPASTLHTPPGWKGRWSAHTQEPQHVVQEWSRGKRLCWASLSHRGGFSGWQRDSVRWGSTGLFAPSAWDAEDSWEVLVDWLVPGRYCK